VTERTAQHMPVGSSNPIVVRDLVQAAKDQYQLSQGGEKGGYWLVMQLVALVSTIDFIAVRAH